MRPELKELLWSRFPQFYGRNPHLRNPSAPFSSDLKDGSFPLVLAVSNVLEWHAERSGLSQLHIQKIEMLRGALHCHVSGGDQFVRGATNAATRMSLAVSAISGTPGRLMTKEHEPDLTLAPGELDGYEPVPARLLHGDGPPIGAGRPGALKALGKRWAQHVAQDLDVPRGWVDIADVLLAAFKETSGRVAWIRAWQGGAVGQLSVAWDAARSSPYQDGVIAFAINMAALTDPETGACGPVDDAGSPEWWRRVAGAGAMPPLPWGGHDFNGFWCSRPDSVSGPLPGHPSAGPLITATHGEDGSMQVRFSPSVAHTLRQMARWHAGRGCAAMLALLLGLQADDCCTEPSP